MTSARGSSVSTAWVDETCSAEKSQGAVEKAVLIIRYLGRKGGVCSLADIARDLQLAKTTAHRLLRTLEAEQAVRRIANGYELGDLRLTAGLTSDDHALLRRHALKGMLRLYELTHLLVQLMVVEDNVVRCVEQFEPPGAGLLSGPVDFGRSWSALETAAGKAVLTLKAHRSSSGRPASRVAHDDGVTHRGLRTSAVPVVADGPLFAAVSVTGPQAFVARGEVQTALAHVARLYEPLCAGLAS
ncbi:helix-turn-helix domain-containing protein [Lentzea sp. NPDC042327]|uniref:helix-turn-helix domain-containing protein n=1 Tax=Lentzea sp. NPDC042327 TaxID=3154801 RepID=UPI0033D2CD12